MNITLENAVPTAADYERFFVARLATDVENFIKYWGYTSIELKLVSKFDYLYVTIKADKTDILPELDLLVDPDKPKEKLFWELNIQLANVVRNHLGQDSSGQTQD